MIVSLGGLGCTQVSVACRGSALEKVARKFDCFGIREGSLIVWSCSSEAHLIKIKARHKKERKSDLF